MLGNLKTSLAGAYHALGYAKYAGNYLAAFCYRFNGRFDLVDLVVKLIADSARCTPHPLHDIRAAEAYFQSEPVLFLMRNMEALPQGVITYSFARGFR